MKTAQIYKAFTAFFALMTVSAVAIVLRPDSELAVWALAPVIVSLAPVFVMEPWLAPKRLIHRSYRDAWFVRSKN